MPKGAFTTEFDPAARAGDVVRIDPADEHYGVRHHAVLPELSFDPIEVEANSIEPNVYAERLEMDTNVLGQFRLLGLGDVPDGVELRFDQGGRESPLHQARNARGYISANTGATTTADGEVTQVFSQFTELFVHEDTAPYITVANPTDQAVTVEPTYSGYQFFLTNNALNDGEFDSQPVAVPTGRIRP